MRRLLVVVLLAVACASRPGAVGQSEAPTPAVASGLRVQRVVTDLAGPTQMAFGPDGRLWVAQLNGGENERQGQVLAIDLDSGAREVVVDGLDKPTGIAWLDGDLWIATRDAILRARGDRGRGDQARGDRARGDRPAEPDAVISGLPNNGRSNGTLTPNPRRPAALRDQRP